jgi:hypothetical protein
MQALIGIVAALGGQYTIHYRRTENTSGIATRGYTPEIIKECREDMPVLRFDLAPSGIAWKDPDFLNGEYYAPTMFDRDIRDTKAFADFYAAQGIPVQTVRQFTNACGNEHVEER